MQLNYLFNIKTEKGGGVAQAYLSLLFILVLVYFVFKDLRHASVSYKVSIYISWHIHFQDIAKTFISSLGRIPFSNLFYETDLFFPPLVFFFFFSFPILSLINKGFLSFFLFFSLVNCFIRLSPFFIFLLLSLFLSITFPSLPAFLIKKHCIYSLGSHCFPLFSKNK